jgi:hypothetical protein
MRSLGAALTPAVTASFDWARFPLEPQADLGAGRIDSRIHRAWGAPPLTVSADFWTDYRACVQPQSAG